MSRLQSLVDAGTSALDEGHPSRLDSSMAVAAGGSSILGGSARCVGAIAGCVRVLPVQSLLPVVSIPEAGGSIISGALVLGRRLLDGRERARR